MLYITRSRMKESVGPQDLRQMSKLLDEEIIPAVEKVTGVRSAQAYNSINGDLTVVLDVENMAAVDTLMADPGCQAVLGKLLGYVVRVGGDVLYDRARWEDLYSKN